MIFLLEYDRRSGELVQMDRFDDACKAQAGEKRLRLELDLLRQGIDHEVVLLEAASEDALRKTHRRYVETLGELRSRASTPSPPPG